MSKHPRKNRSFLHIFATFALCCAVSQAMAAPLRLVYSNDNMGELDGCG